MGKPQSKESTNSGDAQVNIINEIQANNARHVNHEIKLWLLLALNLLQILYKIFNWHQKRVRRKAFVKGCRSQDAVNDV